MYFDSLCKSGLDMLWIFHVILKMSLWNSDYLILPDIFSKLLLTIPWGNKSCEWSEKAVWNDGIRFKEPKVNLFHRCVTFTTQCGHVFRSNKKMYENDVNQFTLVILTNHSRCKPYKLLPSQISKFIHFGRNPCYTHFPCWEPLKTYSIFIS